MFLQTQADSGTQRRRTRNLAKAALVLALASNADAFQPLGLGLRPVTQASNAIGRFSSQATLAGSRQRNNKPLVLATLASPVKEETTLEIKETAKASKEQGIICVSFLQYTYSVCACAAEKLPSVE
jgi:hypothetical protein